MDHIHRDGRPPFAFGPAELSLSEEKPLDGPGGLAGLVAWGMENRVASVVVWSGLPVSWVDPLFGRTHWAGDRPVAESEIVGVMRSLALPDRADMAAPVAFPGWTGVTVSFGSRHAFGAERRRMELTFPRTGARP